MRRFALALVLLLLAVPAAFAADAAALAALARKLGLADMEGFVAAVQTIDRTGKLPPRYLDKSQAEKLGWRPGQDLCKSAPGRALGGDRFMNREGRLPARAGRTWREADLDYACGARGPKRLVYSSDGLRYVTVDHYVTFQEVPR
jgi:hypothetical protein